MSIRGTPGQASGATSQMKKGLQSALMGTSSMPSQSLASSGGTRGLQERKEQASRAFDGKPHIQIDASPGNDNIVAKKRFESVLRDSSSSSNSVVSNSEKSEQQGESEEEEDEPVEDMTSSKKSEKKKKYVSKIGGGKRVIVRLDTIESEEP